MDDITTIEKLKWKLKVFLALIGKLEARNKMYFTLYAYECILCCLSHLGAKNQHPGIGSRVQLNLVLAPLLIASP